MPRYAAFLRGMNVGGHRITSADLIEHFEAMGLEEVAAFRASGNVVFDAGEMKKSAIVDTIEAALVDALGYEVPVYLRSAKEVCAIAAREPFKAAAVKASKGKLQVLMLARKPSKTATDKVLALATDDDKLLIDGSELYWLPSGGYLETELDLKQIDKTLGAQTARTMGTVQQIASKYFGA